MFRIANMAGLDRRKLVLAINTKKVRAIVEALVAQGAASESCMDALPTRGRFLVSDIGTGFYVLKADLRVGDAPPYGTRTTP